MVLTPFMVRDNVQVWHKSTIGVLCRYAASWPTAILEIFSGLPKCHDSTKNEIIQTGLSLHLKIFYLICIVCQIPMVEMFATNMSHKLPFYVASPGCKCPEHRCIKHLVGGSGLLGLLSCTTHPKKSLNK